MIKISVLSHQYTIQTTALKLENFEMSNSCFTQAPVTSNFVDANRAVVGTRTENETKRHTQKAVGKGQETQRKTDFDFVFSNYEFHIAFHTQTISHNSSLNFKKLV